MKPNFTKPKVLIPEDPSKDWLVWFRYNGKLQRYKKGINYYKDLKERLSEANALAAALYSKLKTGWNPLVPEITATQSDLTLFECLDFAMEKKRPNIGPKTISGYNGTVKFIKAAIKSIGIEHLTIVDTKRVHIKLIMEKAKEQRQWSNNAYNKHLNHLKAILSELIQWDIISVNPAHTIKNLEVAESDANVPASFDDIEKIKKELQLNHPYFYNFIITIFHTGIRPEELVNIQLSMINLTKSEITLPAEITKTKKKRIVPINQHLAADFEGMDFEHLPKTFYLFGSFREPGKGNVGKHRDFLPAPTRIKRDTATKRWERIVKKGLEIPMNMYAMKHLGADRKILAGLELDSLRELYGHTSKLMTEKYAKVVKEVYRQQIMDKSPQF